jgi:hypothetical protein
MAKDLGVWTAQDCALVLIDYQNEMSEVIRPETAANVVELEVRLRAAGGRREHRAVPCVRRGFLHAALALVVDGGLKVW